MSEDETRPVKVYKLTVCVIDHDNLGAKGICEVLENTSYPNRCLSPQTCRIVEKEVQWNDDHPLNQRNGWLNAFWKLFDE